MGKSLSKNLILSIGYNILTVIIPFITAPYLARVLGSQEIGVYTYVHAIASYFVMFGLLGIRNYGNRTIAFFRDDIEKLKSTFWEIFGMQLITGLSAFILYVIYVFLFLKDYFSLGLIIGFYVLTAFTTIDWFCEGTEAFSTIATRTLIIKCLNLICIFLFVKSSSDLNVFCTIMSVGYFISSLMVWPYVIKVVGFPKTSYNKIFYHFRPNILLFIPTIAVSVYQIMDKIMIGVIANKTELAYYEYADKIIQVPNLVFVSMGTVMLSRMSNLFKNRKDSAEKVIEYSFDLAFMIGVGFVFGILAVSEELVKVYYGINFLKSYPILMYLTPVVLLFAWSNVLRMQYIIPNNMEKVYIVATIAGAFVNIVANYIFIPRFEALGATIGTVLAQLTVAVIFSIVVTRKLPLLFFLKKNLFLFLIGFIMFWIVKFVQLYHDVSVMGLFIDIFIGIFIYVNCVLMANLVVKNHLLNVIVKNIKSFK